MSGGGKALFGPSQGCDTLTWCLPTLLSRGPGLMGIPLCGGLMTCIWELEPCAIFLI